MVVEQHQHCLSKLLALGDVYWIWLRKVVRSKSPGFSTSGRAGLCFGGLDDERLIYNQITENS
jgi:hypothetical protein